MAAIVAGSSTDMPNSAAVARMAPAGVCTTTLVAP